MSMIVLFAIHRAKKISAVFFGGDEHGFVGLRDGWEELVPRDIIQDERAFDRWIAQDLDARLVGLTPPGFTPKKGIRHR